MKYSIMEKITEVACCLGAIAFVGGAVTSLLCLHWNIGEDNQPAFCIADADKDKVRGLAGSGKRVKVLVPKGFVFASPWSCPMPAQIEIMDGEHER